MTLRFYPFSALLAIELSRIPPNKKDPAMPRKPAPTDNPDTEPSAEFSDADQASIVADLTEDDIRERSQALDEAQEAFDDLAFLLDPKIPCPECAGRGAVSGGSLGDICVRCNGTRLIARPGGTKIPRPEFAKMRNAIGAYGDTLALRQLPATVTIGSKENPKDPMRVIPNPALQGKRLALPPPSSVPTMESIQAITNEAHTRAQLADGQRPGGVDVKQLPDAKPAQGLAGEGDLGEYEDAELATMEDEADES